MPSLSSLMFPRSRQVRISVSDQAVVARWAVKTALMCDFLNATRTLSDDRYATLFATPGVPDEVTVWTAAYVGEPYGLSSFTETLTINETHSFNRDGILVERPATVGPAVQLTMRMYSLVLQVLFHRGSIPQGKSSDAPIIQQIWPSVERTVDWPPSQSAFDAASFDGLLHRRGRIQREAPRLTRGG